MYILSIRHIILLWFRAYLSLKLYWTRRDTSRVRVRRIQSDIDSKRLRKIDGDRSASKSVSNEYNRSIRSYEIDKNRNPVSVDSLLDGCFVVVTRTYVREKRFPFSKTNETSIVAIN